MSTFTLHCKADIHNLSSSPRMPSQQSLTSHSVFLIPWDTFANNPSKVKVFHIMKVESKSISYHAFSLSFSLSLFFTCETRRKRAISQHLVSIFRSGTDCLEPLPDCLPSLAPEYSFSTSYASSSYHICLGNR
ncbi:hypothetical protein FF2_000362 [Malus domestica]